MSESDSSSGTDWREALPESWRDAPYIKAAASADEALQHIKDAAAWQGNSLRIPSEDAGDEDRAKFRAKVMEKDAGLMSKPNLDDADLMAAHFASIGRPENGEGYADFKDRDNAPESEVLSKMRQAALDSNLTAKQFEQFVGAMLANDAESHALAASQMQDNAKALQGEWGGAWEQRLANARRAAELTGAPAEVISGLTEGSINPAVARHYHQVAESLGTEGTQGQAQGKDTERPMDRAELEARIEEVSSRIFSTSSKPEPAQMALLNKQRVKYIEQLVNLDNH